MAAKPTYENLEQKIKLIKAKDDSILENVNDGIVIIQDKQFKYINQSWTRISGCSLKELKNKTIIGLVAPDKRQSVYGRYI